DSVIVMCSSKYGDGIDLDTGGSFLPKVHMHVKCTGTNLLLPKPSLCGPSLEGTYGPYVSDDGTWTIINGLWANPNHTKFMFDLNDSLFTTGYKVQYYFKAYNRQGGSSTLPFDAETNQNYFEFTCLPSGNGGGIVLPWPVKPPVIDHPPFPDLPGFPRDVIDPNSEGDPRRYFKLTLDAVLPGGSASADFYDVQGWDEFGSNGLASRISLDSLMHYYDTIILDSGRIPYGTLSDGTQGLLGGNKQDDVSLLRDWLRYSAHDVGLLVLGDGIASEVGEMISPQAEALMQLCGVTCEHPDYFEMTGGFAGGGEAHPLIEYNSSGPVFWDDFSFYGYGGLPQTSCIEIDDFDVLGTAGSGMHALRYLGFGENHYAGVCSSALNDMGYTMSTLWCGFSLMNIRDESAQVPPARNRFLADVLEWMGHPVGPNVIGVDPPRVYSDHLDRNRPNPFNPSTRMTYGVRERGHTTIRIYDVAGRLVKTLVDEIKTPGIYDATWEGDNNQGQAVSSGIYFCRMQVNGFSKTRKIALLR
ncbi:MAG: T9SS type A sorting domain-containing protein, partial [bacterium]